jgi:hypothetical protein
MITMNKLIVSLMLCASFTAQANEQSKVDTYDLCNNVSITAKRVMEFRQAGVSIVDMMKSITTDFGRELVVDAYSKQFWAYPTHKQQAIHMFATDYYLQCLNDNKDDNNENSKVF